MSCALVRLVLLVSFGLLVKVGPTNAQSLVSDSVRTDAYLLYGPSETTLDEARPQLNAAARRFEEAFGTAPPQIAVLLANDPEALREVDLDPYRKRATDFLPFLTSRGLQAASPDSSGPSPFMLDGGALVTEANGGVRVAKAVSLPSASTPLQTGDQIQTLQGTPVTSFPNFRRRYQALAVGDSVRLRVRREGREGPVTLAYEKAKQSAQISSVTDRSEDGSSGHSGGNGSQSLFKRSLAHEACHAYMKAHAEQWLQTHESMSSTGGEGPGTEGSETEKYGHPQLADWMDEAAATLCEAPSQQERRLRNLRQNFDERISLPDLLAMQHPLAGIQLSTRGSSSTETGKGADIKVMKMENGGDVMQRASLFYGQTLSLARYIREEAGADGLRRIVGALLGGGSLAEVLPEVEGLPASIDALETEWERWMQEE